MSGSLTGFDGNATREETAALLEQAQENFMLRGGIFEAPLARLRARGLLPRTYVFHEYPKSIRLKTGDPREVKRSIVDIDKNRVEWTETREQYRDVIVNSEEEEDRVLNGGKTAAQIEDDRQGLIGQAKARGVTYDPSWSLLRLQRELGMPIADPKKGAAFDELAQLRAQVDRLEESARLRARIAELQAQEVAAPPVDDVETLRSELEALGVTIDKRWGVLRLRQELEQATAPAAA